MPRPDTPYDAPLDEGVQALLRRVAAEIVMPHFGNLAAVDIAEKAPDDLVTIADKAAEIAIADGLRALLPDAGIVGEEASEADPALLDTVEQGVVWIVDPIDGTANYARGRTPFALMVALAVDGTTLGGWIHDPVTGRMCAAWRGHGAYADGARIRTRSTGRALPYAALATRFLTPPICHALNKRGAGRIEEAPVPGCAGEQYARLALGEADVALYWRALPWDHAPGALILEEAGGRLARLDGRPYRLGDRGKGLFAAATPALWDDVHAILFAEPLPAE